MPLLLTIKQQFDLVPANALYGAELGM